MASSEARESKTMHSNALGHSVCTMRIAKHETALIEWPSFIEKTLCQQEPELPSCHLLLKNTTRPHKGLYEQVLAMLLNLDCRLKAVKSQKAAREMQPRWTPGQGHRLPRSPPLGSLVGTYEVLAETP